MRISDWSSDVYSSDLLGDSLHWNAFYCHAQFNEANDLRNLRRTANFALAVDSVRDPVTNAPICRVALTVANSGCVPINLFGEGAPSQQARDYVLGTGQLRQRATLDNGGLSLRGEPFETWAGPVSFALGIEGRREPVRQTADRKSTRLNSSH